ncbi:MAG TPA: UDP-2,3-diacylglucosamine diphosphatase [Burkholderiales bacterium]|nr:UDP-2,3-diacylglucosamine diphosphatase [Burkholderiales bacterium]
MKPTLFVSDLHLAGERPQICAVFFDFVKNVASQAQALYILGDLFEYWIGDDDLDEPLNASVADALGGLGASGITVYFLHGNRDFLIGPAFAARAGATLISDPTTVDLHGTRTLLMHGDTLCTDDVEYQKFRATARNPKFQADFLAQPVAARRQRVGQLREMNAQAKQAKSAEIMDVSPATVEDTLRQFDYPRLIHGHTHRPARHVHVVDGRTCERWVLNDWYERGGYLRCDASGCAAVLL